MSDVKEVGVIGQKYEDRTTGKVGTLDSRDDKCKTLMLIDSDGKGFNVSYSSFRSKWRKAKDSEEVVKETPKVVEKKESDMSVDAVIEAFNSLKNGVQIIEDNGEYCFVKEDFKVMHVKFCKNGTYSVMCLPDIYTDSVELRTYTSEFKCMRTKSGLDVRFKVSKMSFATLVNLVQNAVVDVNLYGYNRD